MKQYRGVSLCAGIAIGTIHVLKKAAYEVPRKEISDVEYECTRYRAARDTAVEQLQAVYKKAIEEVGQDAADIFDVQSMLLMDDDWNDAVYTVIRGEHVCAEYAVHQSATHIAKIFSDMDDEYLRARSADITDVSRRVLTALCGRGDESFSSDGSVILAATDLTPAETVQLNTVSVCAVITTDGSPHSHTAILACTMNIPAIAGIVIDDDWNGKLAVVDGGTGELIISPDSAVLAEKRTALRAIDEQRISLHKLKTEDTVTLDGRHIDLYANVGSITDVACAVENGAEGIGLFRSEFLYVGRSTCPTEAEQFAVYKAAAEKMQGKKIIIRTLDIGADKQADCLQLDREENPALGFRAIRICLERPELFKTQLRAIYRASAFGNIAVMYPLIISVDEVRRIKKISADVRLSLDAAHIPYGVVEEGIMIETPAAVLMSAALAAEVDFFSIGTNDLIQYTLAVDRQNARLASFYDAHHPAVLRGIQMTVESAHKYGRRVGICGELAADPELTEMFITMGIDELSVAPLAILPLRKTIRSLKCNSE